MAELLPCDHDLIMKTYRTKAIVDLYRGTIGLTDVQAVTRVRNLRPVADGIYEIISPVQFKAGEAIRLGEVENTVLDRLECLEIEELAMPDPEVEQSPAPPAEGRYRKKKRK